MKPKLNSEVFLIPSNGSYLVYAPLRRCVMRVPPEGVNLLVRLKQGRLRKGEEDSEFVKGLVRAGLVDGEPERKPATAVGTPYAPTRVTLLLTNQCNLACRYCYAASQEGKLVMDERVGRAAIDYAAANARARGKKTLDVGFHGGGEQTLAFELLVALTAYAREVATRNGLGLRATLGTNGCFSEARAEWLAGNFSEVCISFDGPPRIQDYARPLRNGGPSSPLVRRTVRVFDRAKLLYSFQATVTRDTVGEMPAIVRYFARHTHPFMVKFEPVSDCGRFYGRGDQIPPGGEFARSFNEAYEVARRLRVDLAFSGIRLWGAGHSCFCGAFCEPFAVTPDARVSACYEAYSADAPYADRFLFGCYDADRGTFSFDMAKLKALRQRNVYGLQPCARCFCKYSCAGDCPTRNFRASKTTDLRIVGARCEAIREITRYRLARYVDTQERKPAIPCVGGDL